MERNLGRMFARVFCAIMAAGYFVIGILTAQLPVALPEWWGNLDHERKLIFLVLEGAMVVGVNVFGWLIIASVRKRSL